MMSFKDIEIKTEYRSGKSDVIKDFYIPVLSRAVKYKRAVGFFSSTALIQIAKGISEMVVNGGHIQLIASCNHALWSWLFFLNSGMLIDGMEMFSDIGSLILLTVDPSRRSG